MFRQNDKAGLKWAVIGLLGKYLVYTVVQISPSRQMYGHPSGGRLARPCPVLRHYISLVVDLSCFNCIPFRFMWDFNVDSLSTLLALSCSLFHSSTTLIPKLCFLKSIFTCLLVKFPGFVLCFGMVFWKGRYLAYINLLQFWTPGSCLAPSFSRLLSLVLPPYTFLHSFPLSIPKSSLMPFPGPFP